MSVFEERAPLLKAAEKKMRNNNNSNDEFSVLNNGEDETLMLSSKKKNKKSGGSSKRPGEWRTKSVMIGTTALIFGAALVSTTRTNEDGMNIMSKGESDAGNNNIEGNLGATEEAKSSASKSSASASAADMVTLTLGCTSSSTLGLLPFPNGGFVGKVGAKLSMKSKDHNFAFQHALDMTEVGCGTYVISQKLERGEQFGFYLYDR